MKTRLTVMLLLAVTVGWAQTRQETNLKHWQFSRDGVSWQAVTVPHDWAISGPFDKKWDTQHLAIEQDGQTEAIEHTGRSGALPWIGEGHYKTTVTLDGTRHAELVFDGAMSEPVVYVNGTEAGRWAYGYNAFRVDITPFIRKGANEISVRLNNMEESSRWYPGAGLYRPVKLIQTQTMRIDPWETFFRTLNISADKAQVSIETQLKGTEKSRKIKTEVLLLDARKNIVAEASAVPDASGRSRFTLDVAQPQLWSPEAPNRYTLIVSAFEGRKLVDQTRTKVGIRTVSVSREHGFQLNGISRKFKGVCLHHDLGPLGAAVNRSAIVRQIELMKDMGADAIRTSHNMPSTMQMEVCDSMGMMVMAESFDAWAEPKVTNDYNRFYNEWWRKDITNLIQNHRNHPSIVMWSIGNEIPEQWKPEGTQRATEMVRLCHELDPTRPVTCGVDAPEGADQCGFFAALDVPGFNYRTFLYDKLISNMPQGFILGSETTSTVSSRGVYKFPAEEKKMATYDDGQCSSYDLESCGWSNVPDIDLMLQDDRPWHIGQFVWTGIDYLGEPTPYYSYWPSRSSYFGAVDLAGLPKDRYYLYRAQWNKSDHTLHLLPHWTHPGREGMVTPVYCYTDYPSAELFVNGVSQGIRRQTVDKEQQAASLIAGGNADLDRYRLCWNDVIYQPGELKVIAYDQQGNRAAEKTVRTAGKPCRLRFEFNQDGFRQNVYKKDGKYYTKPDEDDLIYMTVSVLDEAGNECPTLDSEMFFEVTGGANFRALCNGDATSLEPFNVPHMRLFNGKLVLTIQQSASGGDFLIRINCPELGISETINGRMRGFSD